MRVDYGCGERECALGVHAMMLYEQEFGSDIIKDLFGRVVLRRQADDPDVEFAMDYRDTNWTAAVKALWAGLKSADESVPPFREWERSAGAIDMNAVVAALIPEAWRMFFRAGADDSE